MKTTIRGLVVFFALAVCSNPDRNRTEATLGSDSASSTSNHVVRTLAPVIPGVVDTVPKPPPPQVTLAFPLASAGNLRTTGIVQLAAVGHRTSLATSLSGGHPGSTYMGDVRGGTCRRVGSWVASLDPVSADTLGQGTSASDISVPVDNLLRRPHVVTYGKGGRSELCGEIPSRGVRSASDTAVIDSARPAIR